MNDAPQELPVVNATSAQVIEAKRLRRIGWSYGSIARRYGLRSERHAAIMVGEKPEAFGRVR